MGFLFILLVGLAAIILIARFGSKASGRGAAAKAQNGKERIGYEGGKSQAESRRYFQEAVISLLLKKGIITEEELLSEVEMIRKDEQQH